MEIKLKGGASVGIDEDGIAIVVSDFKKVLVSGCVEVVVSDCGPGVDVTHCKEVTVVSSIFGGGANGTTGPPETDSEQHVIEVT